MSVGDSIFLSSILIALVITFAVTKDRWNWRKIFKWGVIAPCLLLVLAIAGTVGYERYKDLPAAQDEFFGVRLKATKGDVKFAKGEASTSSSDKDGWLYSVPAGGDAEGWYRIVFRGDEVRFVMFLPAEGQRYSVFQPRLLGFKVGDSYEEVVAKLGQPSYMATSDDQLRRMLSYDKFNVFFGFSKGQIEVYGVYDPVTGPIKFSGN